MLLKFTDNITLPPSNVWLSYLQYSLLFLSLSIIMSYLFQKSPFHNNLNLALGLQQWRKLWFVSWFNIHAYWIINLYKIIYLYAYTIKRYYNYNINESVCLLVSVGINNEGIYSTAIKLSGQIVYLVIPLTNVLSEKVA